MARSCTVRFLMRTFLFSCLLASVSWAEPGVEFYIHDPLELNIPILVGDPGVILNCEAKELMNPVFTLSLDESEFFDGRGISGPFSSRIQVDVSGSCLQMNFTSGIESSMTGLYTCAVMSEDAQDYSADLQLDIVDPPLCVDNGSSIDDGLHILKLACIYPSSQVASWTFFSTGSNATILARADTLRMYELDSTKSSLQLSLAAATSNDISQFTCTLDGAPTPSCGFQSRDDIFMSQSRSVENITRSISCSDTTNTTSGMESTSSTMEPADNPWPKILIAIAVVVVVILLIVVILRVCLFVRRKRRERLQRHRDEVRNAFGGRLTEQVKHLKSHKGLTLKSANGGTATTAYDSVNEVPPPTNELPPVIPSSDKEDQAGPTDVMRMGEVSSETPANQAENEDVPSDSPYHEIDHEGRKEKERDESNKNMGGVARAESTKPDSTYYEIGSVREAETSERGSSEETPTDLGVDDSSYYKTIRDGTKQPEAESSNTEEHPTEMEESSADIRQERPVSVLYTEVKKSAPPNMDIDAHVDGTEGVGSHEGVQETRESGDRDGTKQPEAESSNAGAPATETGESSTDVRRERQENVLYTEVNKPAPPNMDIDAHVDETEDVDDHDSLREPEESCEQESEGSETGSESLSRVPSVVYAEIHRNNADDSVC